MSLRRTFSGWRSTFVAGLMGVGLTAPGAALAMSCDDIMNMVSVNVPTNIVVSTMQGSGHKFTPAEVSCLKSRGAPVEVVSAAQRMSTTAAPAPAPVAAPVPRPGGPPPVAPPRLSDDLPVGELAPEPDAGGPPVLQELIEKYRAKRYLTASNGLYELLQNNTYPAEKTKIQYYLAKSLYDMGLYHSAQHYFMEVVRTGPSNPYFKYALPRLVAIAQHTGNDYELLRIVNKIPPEAFPRQAKNHLYYLMGRRHFDKDELAESANYFQQISAKSDLYMRSKYFEGIIHQQRGKLKSSVMAFREVMTSEPPLMTSARNAQEVEDLKDLALINVARIYFGLERFDNADSYYAMVDRDSTYWPESLFEQAWTNFWRADLNKALGLLLTVESPYYDKSEFIPEVKILRALTFWNLCEYDEIERVLTEFEGDYQPMIGEMKQFLDQYRTPEMKKLADQAYDAYFVNPHRGSALQQAMFMRILRNRDLAAMVRHMDMMDEEIASIDAQKGVWKSTVGDGLKRIIAEDRVRYKRAAGLYLLKAMANQYEIINDLLVQSEIIRFEVVDAQRQDYEYKMQNPDVDANQDNVIDFAVSRDIIYWPFNGEFWSDELGYYRYTEHGSCK